ncbi:VanZ family protein [Patescibacteria group bacterium]
MSKHFHKIYDNIEQKVIKFIKHEKAQLVLANKHFQKYEKWLLLIIWAGGIYFLSSQSLSFIASADVSIFVLRKIAHAFEFGFLAFLLFRIFSFGEKRHFVFNLILAFVFSVMYAIFDEYHQTQVAGRFGVYSDVLIDTLGSFIAVWLLYLFSHHKTYISPKNKKK